MSRRRSGLGRGLDALLGAEPEAPEVGAVETVAVGLLEPNPMQPRTDFDDAGIAELAESIRSQGVIQPIVGVRRVDGSFSIIAGERRWRAARRAGLTEVPVLVREVGDDRELLELALVENLQRSNLNPIEEAEAYSALRERFGLSQKTIADRVGKSRTTVTNMLRLLRLPDEVLILVRSGQLSAGQARPLLALGEERQQIEVAHRAVEERLSARELEQLARGESRPKTTGQGAKKAAESDVHSRVAQEKLTRALHSKVEIRRRGDGGQIRIHFHSEDELMRIYEILVSP